MRRWAGGWRVGLRIARRDALRHKGRSLLVLVMVALPVVAVSFADVAWRSNQEDPVDLVSGQLGERAQAVLRLSDYGQPIQQSPDGTETMTAREANGAGTAPPQPVGTSLPASAAGALHGLQVLPAARLVSRTMRFGDRLGSVDVRELAYDDPRLSGLVTQVSGRAPRGPDEVSVSQELTRHTGLSEGSTFQLGISHRAVRVVGVVRERGGPLSRTVFTAPGTMAGLVSAEHAEPWTVQRSWYAVGPTPLAWPDVLRLNESGVVAVSRAVVLDPPRRADVPLYRRPVAERSTRSVQTVALAVLAAGMALLEVVLLAGPAFAVGVRRSRRQLALLSAAGGEPRHVRGVVVAGGVVLGAVAGAAGAALGVALAEVALPLAERFGWGSVPRLDVRPLELLPAAGLGLVTATLAALLPARTASRQDVVAALAGRRADRPVRRRVPVIGAVVTVAGTGLAAYGALNHSPVALLAGAAVAELGLVATTGMLVAVFARLARWAPLSPRLALRDAARARTRSAPAVAAVMAAVAGSVSVSFYLASSTLAEQRHYSPMQAVGTTLVGANPEASDQARLTPATLDRAMDLARRELRVTAETPVRVALQPKGRLVEALDDPAKACPELEQQALTASQTEAAIAADPWCRRGGDRYLQLQVSGWLVDDDGSTLRAVTGELREDAAAALRAGQVVVSDPHLIDARGNVRLRLFDPEKDPGGLPSQRVPTAVVPGHLVRLEHPLLAPVLPSSVARRLGLPVRQQAVLVQTDGTTPEAVQERLAATFADEDLPMQVYVERGYQGGHGAGLLALAIGAGLVTLGAGLTATGLALADARPDLATLAGVGAPPRVRRALAASQALVVCGLGVTLGLVAGLVPGVGAVLVQRRSELAFLHGQPPTWGLVVPWRSLGAVVVLVPLLAAACAWVFTRSRIPLARRLGQ